MYYTVTSFHPTSPGELQTWLNGLYEQEGLKLVSADGGYYIFVHARQTAWATAKETLTVREVAKLADMHVNTIRSAIRSGKLVATKPTGSHWRIAKSDMLLFIGDSRDFCTFPDYTGTRRAVPG